MSLTGLRSWGSKDENSKKRIWRANRTLRRTNRFNLKRNSLRKNRAWKWNKATWRQQLKWTKLIDLGLLKLALKYLLVIRQIGRQAKQDSRAYF